MQQNMERMDACWTNDIELDFLIITIIDNCYLFAVHTSLIYFHS